MFRFGIRSAAFVIATGFCLAATVRDFAARFADPAVPEHLSGWRAAMRAVPDDVCAVPCDDPADPDPVTRARLIALTWEGSPKRALPCSWDDLDRATLITPALLAAAVRERLTSSGYACTARNEFAAVWARGQPARDDASAPRAPGLLAEAAGSLTVLLAVFAAFAVFRRVLGDRPSAAVWMFGAAIFFLVSAVTLQHGLLTPNGLGVQAGKAKLFWTCGGVPSGFWTDPAFAVLQPAYPPGLTVLAFLAFALSGGCGEHFVQLLGPFALAALFVEIATSARDRRGWIAGALFVLSPTAVRLASGFYAEPWAALLLVCGVHACRAGRPVLGGTVAGCAALFRPEALVLILVAAAWMRIRVGTCSVPWSAAVGAFAPAVVWWFFVRFAGARLYGFAAAACPDPKRMLFALRAWSAGVVRIAASGAAVVFAALGERCSRQALVVAGIAGGLGIVLAGFNVSARFEWAVENLMPRFIWLSCAVPCALAFGRRPAE